MIGAFRINTISMGATGSTNSYWISLINGSGNESYIDLDLTSTGDLYTVIVSSSPTLIGNGDFLLIKYDTNGTVLWNKRIGKSATTMSGGGVSSDSSGNAYITFTEQLIKINSDGTYGTAYGYTGNQFTRYGPTVIDSSGNFYTVAGGNLTSATLCTVNKFTSSWVASWGRQNGHSTTSVDFAFTRNKSFIDSSGNIYICQGHTTGATACVVKINSSGTQQWAKYYTTSNATRSQHTNPNGMTWSMYYNGTATKLEALDSTGTSAGAWTTTFTTSVTMRFASDSSNNLYMCYTDSTIGGTTSFFICKINSSGTVQWERKVTTSGSPISLSVYQILCNADGLYISYQFVPGSGDTQVIAMKVPLNGPTDGTYTVGSITVTVLTETRQTFTSTSSSLAALTFNTTGTVAPTVNNPTAFTVNSNVLTPTITTY